EARGRRLVVVDELDPRVVVPAKFGAAVPAGENDLVRAPHAVVVGVTGGREALRNPQRAAPAVGVPAQRGARGRRLGQRGFLRAAAAGHGVVGVVDDGVGADVGQRIV